MNIGSLVTTLGFSVDHGSKKNALASIDQVEKSAKGLGLTIGGLAAGFGALWAVRGMVEYTGQMEMLNSQFKVMLGSASQANKIMRDIRQMAAVTPFETEDLASSARLMATFGAETENLLGYVGMLGDATMGDKVRFNQMSLAFSQMLAANKLMGQDLLQMTTAGYNPLETIAKMRKISYDKALAMMQRGQITPQMVVEALQKDTGEGGKFYKGMLEGAKTIPGLTSTISDNLKALSLSFGTIASPMIKDSLAGIVTGLSKMIPYVQTLSADLFSLLRPALDAVGGAGIRVGEMLWSLREPIVAFTGVAVNLIIFLKEQFISLAWAVGPVVDVIREALTNALQELGITIDENRDSLLTFWVIVRNVAKDIAPMLANILNFVMGLGIMIAKVAKFLSKYMQTITTIIAGALAGLAVYGVGLLAAKFVALGTALAATSTLATGAVVALNPMVGVFMAIAGAIGIATESLRLYTDANDDSYEAAARRLEADLQGKKDEIISQRQNLEAYNRGQSLLPDFLRNSTADAQREKQIAALRKQEDAINKQIYAYRDSAAAVKAKGTDTYKTEEDLKAELKKYAIDSDGMLKKYTDSLEAAMKKYDIKMFNNVNVSTTVDDKGKTQLSPEALEHSLDKAMRSLFDLKVINVANLTL